MLSRAASGGMRSTQSVCRYALEASPPKQKRSWPRAAYWLRGSSRTGTACCSAPVKVPMVPLHDFVSGVGPLPDQSLLTTVVLRMREQGWNVADVIQKALSCGAYLDASICRITRLPVRLLVTLFPECS